MEGAARQARGSKWRRAGRRLLRIAVPVLVVAVVVLLLRQHVGDIYVVREQSMYPGLLGGTDRIFVLNDSTLPGLGARFDVWIFRDDRASPAGNGQHLRVKRLIGLEGEVVDFQAGDVWVGRDRASLARVTRPPEILEAMLIPLFRSRSDPGEDRFFVASGSMEFGKGGAVALNARADESGLRATFLGDRLRRSEAIRDDSVDISGTHLPGVRSVPDVRVSFELLDLAVGSRLVVRHSLDADSREVRVTAAAVEVVERSPDAQERVIARVPTPALPFRVLMETIDGRFRLLMGRSVDEFVPILEHPRDTLRFGGHSSVTLQLDRETANLAFLDIHRDVHYFWPPSLGEPHKIRSGSVFLVGDNPRSSRDSREEDDVSHRALVGRATAIVWPPSRWRYLGRR